MTEDNNNDNKEKSNKNKWSPKHEKKKEKKRSKEEENEKASTDRKQLSSTSQTSIVVMPQQQQQQQQQQQELGHSEEDTTTITTSVTTKIITETSSLILYKGQTLIGTTTVVNNDFTNTTVNNVHNTTNISNNNDNKHKKKKMKNKDKHHDDDDQQKKETKEERKKKRKHDEKENKDVKKKDETDVKKKDKKDERKKEKKDERRKQKKRKRDNDKSQEEKNNVDKNDNNKDQDSNKNNVNDMMIANDDEENFGKHSNTDQTKKKKKNNKKRKQNDSINQDNDNNDDSNNDSNDKNVVPVVDDEFNVKNDCTEKSIVVKVPVLSSKLQSRKAPASSTTTTTETSETPTPLDSYPLEPNGRPLVESYTTGTSTDHDNDNDNTISLLLFYQYVEPMWDDRQYNAVIKYLEQMAEQLTLSGRMRVAKEGLNCTVSTPNKTLMYKFIINLRQWMPQIFLQTEFKLTHNLPQKQRFPTLKILKVIELVHYGLAGKRAPSISKYSGVHLEPKEYHTKLTEPDVVVIDVRNHYEAIIGHFDPPTIHHNNQSSSSLQKNDTNKQDSEGKVSKSGSTTTNTTITPTDKYIDPKMRKSTEFPVWLTSNEAKEKLRGKQVMMYCTGGIRCERASALLKYKMDTDPSIAQLNIKGVYQLQGGIDKYFKEFPNGGYWTGKNYVFDKRFSHTPMDNAVVVSNNNTKDSNSISANQHDNNDSSDHDEQQQKDMMKQKQNDDDKKDTVVVARSKCEACGKGWDMYRGKRRCPTCGVPSLICKDCFLADINGTRKLDKTIRCDLCVEQKIFSKYKLTTKIQTDIEQYEQQSIQNGTLFPQAEVGCSSTNTHNNTQDQEQREQRSRSNSNNKKVRVGKNPNMVTRLRISNLSSEMTQELLCETIPGITHIVWKMDRTDPTIFLGVAWVEIDTPKNAAIAVAQSNRTKLLNLPIKVQYQPPDPKDAWPPASSSISYY